MRRPTYGVLTGVVTAMGLMCAVRLLLQSQIPPAHPEISRWGQGEFVERAEDQDIAWRRLGPEAFAEAQKLSRPVLIVIGVPWSAVGRQADGAFATPEVARALNRGFIPIRVDAAQDPRWLTQFLPVQRAQVGFSVGFQCWVFDLKGRLIDFVGRVGGEEVLNAPTVVDSLLTARRKFADAVLSDEPPELERQQRADVERLIGPLPDDLSLRDPDLRAVARTLASATDPTWGGWDVQGLIVGRPLATRFLQLTGEWDAAGDSLRRTIFSPRADWLDGGFYRLVRRRDQMPEYDKSTVTNAEFAETLAVQDAARPDPNLRRAARRTIGWILKMLEDGLAPGGEIGDEDERGRSARASFSPRRLRDAVGRRILTPVDRDWADDKLRLNTGARIPTPVPSIASSPRLEQILDALRRAAGPPRVRAASKLCDVNGAVAASVLRCARLWNDRELADVAGQLVDRLERFREGEIVRHSLVSPQPLYLGDALAYADAAFEDFLTNGRIQSLTNGAQELRFALQVFGGPEPGVLRPSRAQETLMPGMIAAPDVTDDEREALSAAGLRLLHAYGTALGNDGRDFAAFASDLDSRLAALAGVSPSLGGVLGALARRRDDRTAFVVGGGALDRANRLARRLPNRLIVPAIGPARRDLQNRRPGIYLNTPQGLVGPLTESQLLSRLPATLAVD